MIFREPRISVFLSVLFLILAWVPAKVESGISPFSDPFSLFKLSGPIYFQIVVLSDRLPSLLKLQNGTGLNPGDVSMEPAERTRQKRFVKKVLDGDTVELENGERVRYIGIDTPELRRFEKGVWVMNPEPFGVSAFRFNQKLVEHRPVFLEFDHVQRDSHHRLLAYLFVEGMMVNGVLVQEGLARVSLYPPNTRYADALLNMQRQAWEQRKGFWKGPPNE